MGKPKRMQRIIGLTKRLVDSPSHLFSLADFCLEFKVAKSTLSEDIQAIRATFESYGFGSIETITGAGGGVRYLPIESTHTDCEQLDHIAQMLRQKERILPGGFLYMNDILFSPDLCFKLAKMFYKRMRHLRPDYILTVETKGIPIALMVAKVFDVPLVVARRGSKVTEGSALSINYASGSTKILQTMSLPKRALPTGSRVIIIDDFMRAGGTAQGLVNLVGEFDAGVVGIGVLITTKTPQEKLIKDYLAFFEFNEVDEQNKTVNITPLNIASEHVQDEIVSQ